MDVTCEKCGAEYEFDGTLVSETGTSVKCTSCGHVFKIFRRDDGSVAGARRPWTVKLPSGELESIATLRELQRLITIGHLPPDAQISRSGESWKRLRDIVELETFFMAAKASGNTPPPRPKKSEAPPRPPAPTRTSHARVSDAEVTRERPGGAKIQTLPPPSLIDPSIPPSIPKPPVAPKASTPPPPNRPAPGQSGQSTLAWDQPSPPSPKSIPPQSGGTLAWGGGSPDAAAPPAPTPPPATSTKATPSVRPPMLHASDEDLARAPNASRGVPPILYIGIGLAIGVGATAIGLWTMMPRGPAAEDGAGTATAAPTAPPDAPVAASAVDAATPLDAATPAVDAAVLPTVLPAVPDAATAVPQTATSPSQANAATPAAPTATRGETSSGAPPNRDFEYYVDKGRTLIESGDSRGARAHFEAALRMRPNDPDALVGLGWVAANSSRLQEAIEHFRAASQRGSTEAYIGLGQMYRTLGQNGEALEAYRTYLSRNPNGSYARVAQRWVGQLAPNEAPPAQAPTAPPAGQESPTP